ncbi:MAG: PAS domain S-box protein, partial [Anaerolineae bacterium]
MQNSSALQQENEQLRAQVAQLKLRLNELRNLFDTMPVMFWLNSKDGQILRVNHAAAAVEGKTPEALEGK